MHSTIFCLSLQNEYLILCYSVYINTIFNDITTVLCQNRIIMRLTDSRHRQRFYNDRIWLRNEGAKIAYSQKVKCLPSSFRAPRGYLKLCLMLVRVKILPTWDAPFNVPVGVVSWLSSSHDECRACARLPVCIWQVSHVKQLWHPHECLLWNKVMLRIISKRLTLAGPILSVWGHPSNDTKWLDVTLYMYQFLY